MPENHFPITGKEKHELHIYIIFGLTHFCYPGVYVYAKVCKEPMTVALPVVFGSQSIP